MLRRLKRGRQRTCELANQLVQETVATEYPMGPAHLPFYHGRQARPSSRPLVLGGLVCPGCLELQFLLLRAQLARKFQPQVRHEHTKLSTPQNVAGDFVEQSSRTLRATRTCCNKRRSPH